MSHSNPWDISQLKHMKIDDIDDTKVSNTSDVAHQTILSPFEAEEYAENLKSFTIEQVGSSEYIQQHYRLEKLNLQAHMNAVTNTDEYVIEAILTFSKLSVLIHELLVIQIWKEKIYPLLFDSLAGRNNIRLYFILYHEATLVNLLEVLLYHKHICESIHENMIEIVDYVASKILRLQNEYNFRAQEPIGKLATLDAIKAIESKSPIDQMQDYFQQIEFQICISSVAIGRFITEHADVLPLSVLSRLTDTHDFLILLIPLIENPPWTRRVEKKWQKVINHAWKDVEPIDLLRVTKLEGQPWISLFHFLSKNVFRERYFLNTFRKGQLLRLRKYINEIMLDQLPFLADIQRYMDELAIMEVPEPNSLSGMQSSGVLMMQQVALIRENIMKNKRWQEIAENQLKTIFTMTDKDDADIKQIADIYTDYNLDVFEV